MEPMSYKHFVLGKSDSPTEVLRSAQRLVFNESEGWLRFFTI